MPICGSSSPSESGSPAPQESSDTQRMTHESTLHRWWTYGGSLQMVAREMRAAENLSVIPETPRCVVVEREATGEARRGGVGREARHGRRGGANSNHHPWPTARAKFGRTADGDAIETACAWPTDLPARSTRCRIHLYHLISTVARRDEMR
ncbi:hypothetical protein K458DRAFT_112339 [Lentithecium fluviatile CBS 122367]|uniref:Uncharacterized protein n=1 Tax=Lentithecium fluviatile CBS 122367 TaxID=1168545 RepID=A0A6G1IPM9_9PLEO|nr:hypothetical protein K458DRAFT_112339 [Lentithecium fluviatile CBS 122367]